jgi:predicted PurR-regulated permease PerM
MKPIHFLVFALGATVILLWQIFDPFLKSIFIALLLVIATNSITTYFEFRLKSRLLTTFVMTMILAALFIVPLTYFVTEFVMYLNSIDQQNIVKFVKDIQGFVANMPDDFVFIKEQLELALASFDVKSTIAQLVSAGTYIGKNSASIVIDIVLILAFYSFIIFYGKELTLYVKEALPLKKEDSSELFLEVSNVMGVVFYSVIINALLQGFLFGIFITNFGYDGLLLGILYGFASLIPIVGGAIMWVPLALVEVFNGNLTDAIYIALYTIIVISILADTIIKPMVIGYINHNLVRSPTKVNEIIIFFAILAGLSTFGFWGMIIGPAAVAFFISLMTIIKRHHLLEN